MAGSTSPPVSYGVLLFPGFEILDIAGPLEALNSLARRPAGANITLAVIGRPISDDQPNVPMEISPADPSPEVLGAFFLSQQVYRPSHTFHTAPRLDVLLVPGGLGCQPPAKALAETEFVRKVYPSLQYLFTICNGVSIAARAGVLDGHRATGDKALWRHITALGPKTDWIAQARWMVSGNIWTTSGVSAGIDGIFAYLDTVYPESGYPGLVEKIQNLMEYNREFDPNNDPFAKYWKAEDVLNINEVV